MKNNNNMALASFTHLFVPKPHLQNLSWPMEFSESTTSLQSETSPYISEEFIDAYLFFRSQTEMWVEPTGFVL